MTIPSWPFDLSVVAFRSFHHGLSIFPSWPFDLSVMAFRHFRMRSCCQPAWRSVNIALAISECLHDAADELFVDVTREIDYHEDVGIGIGM